MSDQESINQDIAIVFADVVDSSRLYATYGDAEARRIVGGCLKAMTQVVGEHEGTVVKNIGDEIMCTFPTSSQAVMAAVVMQQRLSELTRAGSLHASLSLRIGVHHGAAVREGNDYFGDAVNLAARMASLSKAHQIMTTRQTVEALDGGMRPLARFVDKSTIKGQVGAFDLYEIVWNSGEATMAVSGVGPRNLPVSQRTMDVVYGGKTWSVNIDHPVVTMGRSNQCDILVDDVRASRLHAKIEYGKDRFILRDVSTNGTHVTLEASGAHLVRRDDLLLDSAGLICLGRPVEPDAPLNLKITIREGMGTL